MSLPDFNKLYASDETAQATTARLRLGGIDLPPKVWDEIGEFTAELYVAPPPL